MPENKKQDSFQTQYYYDIVQNSVSPDKSDLNKIKAYFSEDSSMPFAPEEIATFEGWISNNIIDRSMNRLPLDTLKSLSETIVGKSKIIHHDINEIPDGRFFKSQLEQVSVEAALKIIGAVPYKKKDFQRMLEITNEKDGGIYWLVATFYMLQGTPEEKAHVRKVRAGLLRDMSLSFYVPKRVAILEDDTEMEVSQWTTGNSVDDKRVLYYEWRNADDIKAEAVEGSHVFLGRVRGTISQQDDFQAIQNQLSLIVNHYDSKNNIPIINEPGTLISGTKIDKDSKQETSDIQHSNSDIDISKQTSTQINQKQDSIQTKEKVISHKETKLMEIKLAGFEKDFTLLPDSLEADIARLAQAVNHKLETLTSENSTFKNDNATMKTEIETLKKFDADYKQAFGELAINQVQQIKNDAEALKTFLIQETLTFKKLAGFKVDDKAAEGFQKMSVETIMEMLKEFRNQMSNSPGYGWLAGNFEQKIQNEPEKPKEEPDAKIITPEKVPDHFRRKFMM